MARFIYEEPARGGYPDPSSIETSGLERIQSWIKRRMPNPPMHHLFGIRPVEVGIGTCTCLTPASPWLQSHSGLYTGGIGALVADAALGGAIASGLEPWWGLATSQLTMNFLRPAGPWSGRLSARGKLIHTTPTVGLSEVHVEDANGRLLAHGTSRCFLQEFDPQDVPQSPLPPVVAPSYDTPDPYLRPVEGAVLRAAVLDSMSGLEFFHALMSGEIPASPVGLLLGLSVVEIAEGSATITMPAHEWLCAPEARVYGGATAYLAHDSMAIALQSTLPKGTAYATLDLTVNFVRPIPADARELRARARVFHKGRTFAVAGTEIVNADGKTVATGSSSSMVLPGRSLPGEPDYELEFCDGQDTAARR
jgi:uncharacterized protein (TIGR00369 family)